MSATGLALAGYCLTAFGVGFGLGLTLKLFKQFTDKI